MWLKHVFYLLTLSMEYVYGSRYFENKIEHIEHIK